MKEVVNISLQGISFTIEKDALELLEQYLDELKRHYGEQESEVVNDIEERIAELLIEKGCKEAVVQYYQVDEIINILGRPSQIEGEVEPQVKKKIYRDTQNGIVAGVCSGLGAYFNIDAVWVRVMFFAVAFLITTPILSIGKTVFRVDMGWAGFMLLAYCVMWIIIPAAKTVEQKCQMRGESQSVDQIHRKFAGGAQAVGKEMWQTGTKFTGSFFSILWKVICFMVGVLLTAMGFCGMITLGIFLFGVNLPIGIHILSIPDFVELNIGSTIWLKLFGVLTFLLPCVGMLYGGMQLCFRFKSPKWRPGMVIFIMWLVCVTVFSICSAKACNPYFNMEDYYKERLSLGGQKDTIYIECPDAQGIEKGKLNMQMTYNTLRMFYLADEPRKETKFAVYPYFIIKRSSDITEPYIETKIISQYWGEAKLEDVVNGNDSLVTLIPQVYSRERKFAGMMPTVRLYIPDSTTVILSEPMECTFGQKNYRCGMFN